MFSNVKNKYKLEKKGFLFLSIAHSKFAGHNWLLGQQ